MAYITTIEPASVKEEALQKFKDLAVPFKRNLANAIFDVCARISPWKWVLPGLWLIAFSFLTLTGFNFEKPPAGASWGLWLSWAAAAYVFFSTLVWVFCCEIAAKPIEWKKVSVTDITESWDLVIPGDHPVRKAIIEARKKNPEAEFVIEYPPTADEREAEIPGSMILWMYPSPFTSAEVRAVLTLRSA